MLIRSIYYDNIVKNIKDVFFEINTLEKDERVEVNKDSFNYMRLQGSQ